MKLDEDYEKVMNELQENFGWSNIDVLPESYQDLLNDTIMAVKNLTIQRVSCRLLYAETSKTINGYSQMNAMPRALGFKNTYEIQNKIYKYRHLITADDVVTVCEWLFENGYDVVKLNGN